VDGKFVDASFALGELSFGQARVSAFPKRTVVLGPEVLFEVFGLSLPRDKDGRDHDDRDYYNEYRNNNSDIHRALLLNGGMPASAVFDGAATSNGMRCTALAFALTQAKPINTYNVPAKFRVAKEKSPAGAPGCNLL
jgi:hypothetical protein